MRPSACSSLLLRCSRMSGYSFVLCVSSKPNAHESNLFINVCLCDSIFENLIDDKEFIDDVGPIAIKLESAIDS